MTDRSLIVAQDATEDHIIDLWVRLKKSPQTRRAYRHDVDVFRSFCKKPLASVTLEDALDYLEALKTLEITNKRGEKKLLEDNSARRMLNSVKSLYTFCYKSGVFPANVFAAIIPPTAKSAVSQRILSENMVLKMIVLEQDPRNHAILHTLYASGMRVSELCNLTWRNVIRRAEGCQLDITGKGDKQRHVLLKESSWVVLSALHKEGTELSDFVFLSRQQGHHGEYDGKQMDTSQVFRLVREAAHRAGIPNWAQVSPHWIRHCHGSHSIQRGAPLPVVRDTMGHASLVTTNTYAHARPNESSSLYLPL